jgi:phage tail-like protein
MASVQTPAGNFIFQLNLGGAEKAAFFAEASGLSTENQVIEHTAADANGKPLPQRFAGQVRWSNIVLKRGVDTAQQLWTWRQAILNGEIESNRQTVTITVLDQTAKAVAAYSFLRAWPCKYSSPGLNAGGNEILVEEIELAHEGFTRTQ